MIKGTSMTKRSIVTEGALPKEREQRVDDRAMLIRNEIAQALYVLEHQGVGHVIPVEEGRGGLWTFTNTDGVFYEIDGTQFCVQISAETEENEDETDRR